MYDPYKSGFSIGYHEATYMLISTAIAKAFSGAEGTDKVRALLKEEHRISKEYEEDIIRILAKYPGYSYKHKGAKIIFESPYLPVLLPKHVES